MVQQSLVALRNPMLRVPHENQCGITTDPWNENMPISLLKVNMREHFS